MDYGYVIIDDVPVYQVSIDGRLVVTGDIIGGTTSGGGTLHANRIDPIPPVTAVQIDNIICDTVDVSDNLLQSGEAHSKHTLDTSNAIVSRGQFVCVHDVDFTEQMGFCFGPNEDDTTGDYNFMVNDPMTNAVVLASNVAGVITPMFSADKTTGVVTFPNGINATIVSDTIQTNEVNEISAIGVSINGELLADSSNNRVDISNTLRCNNIDPLSGTTVSAGSLDIINNGVTGTFLAPTSTLERITLSCNTGTIHLLAPSVQAFHDIYAVGAVTMGSMNVTGVNLADKPVLVWQSSSDAGYGTPVGGAIMYTDSDNIVKTKNTSGQIVGLSSIPSYGSFYRIGNGTDSIITTADTWTKCLTLISSSVASGFSLPGSQTRFTYTGTQTRNLWIHFSGSILTSNNGLLCGLACAKNATFNGSNELTSSVINGSVTEATINTAGQEASLSASFVVSAATNDIFDIVIRNSTTADDINLRVVSITVQAFTAGLD